MEHHSKQMTVQQTDLDRGNNMMSQNFNRQRIRRDFALGRVRAKLLAGLLIVVVVCCLDFVAGQPSKPPITKRAVTFRPSTIQPSISFEPTTSPMPSSQPSVSAKPTTSPAPSTQPSISPRPSVSPAPSTQPSVSARPSKSPAPSAQPSVSARPSDSPVPSSEPSTPVLVPTLLRQEAPEVLGFTLVNSQTDNDIRPLTDGSVIVMNQTPDINIRANTSPLDLGTGSVVFYIDDNFERVENGFPYALAGDDGNGDYGRWSPRRDTQTISAIIYEGTGGTGEALDSLSIQITVVQQNQDSPTAPIPDPTPPPAPEPSPPPTDVPVPDPTPAPTTEATNEPTGAPPPDPTPAPLPIPTTPMPTPEPSIAPIAATDAPTDEPTPGPTPAPVTPDPTPSPSAEPTGEPTREPTGEPTREPTPVPTKQPTPFPTLAPTPDPTPVSTKSPTREPTPFPTPRPSPRPSAQPSDAPSPEPTVTPQPTITDRPTPRPTTSPAPSSSPTGTPSIRPSTQPSMAPSRITLSPTGVLQEFYQTGFLMKLGGVEPMNQNEINTWKTITGVHITQYVENALEDEQDLVIVVSYQDQDPRFGSGGRGLRQLQSPPQLTIDFDVTMFVRSEVTNHTVIQYVNGAFADEVGQQVYLVALRASDPAFANAGSVAITSPNATPSPAPLVTPSGGNKTAGIAGGLAAAGALCVAVGGFLLYARRKKHLAETAPDNQQRFDDYGVPQAPYVSEIDVPGDDSEISTLGDPIPPGVQPDWRDPSVADSTFSFDYDFQRAYHLPASLATSVDETNTNLLVPEDDATLQEQYILENHFEVEAPPGMLGIVLETVGESSVPTVHAIKENSPIASQVRVGDQLLSVDGENVTVMLASEVSRLIASRMQNPVRHFVFARPSVESKDGTRDEEPPVSPDANAAEELNKSGDSGAANEPFDEGASFPSISTDRADASEAGTDFPSVSTPGASYLG